METKASTDKSDTKVAKAGSKADNCNGYDYYMWDYDDAHVSSFLVTKGTRPVTSIVYEFLSLYSLHNVEVLV